MMVYIWLVAGIASLAMGDETFLVFVLIVFVCYWFELERDRAMALKMTKPAFEQELQRMLQEAPGETCDVRAGDLHRRVGGYPPKPGANHHMPLCSRVMLEAMRNGDKVVEGLPGGAGASLTIRYRTPNRVRGSGPRRGP